MGIFWFLKGRTLDLRIDWYDWFTYWNMFAMAYYHKEMYYSYWI